MSRPPTTGLADRSASRSLPKNSRAAGLARGSHRSEGTDRWSPTSRSWAGTGRSTPAGRARSSNRERARRANRWHAVGMVGRPAVCLPRSLASYSQVMVETGRTTLEVPYADLKSAVAVVKTIRKQVGGDQCEVDQLAAWLRCSSADDGEFRQQVDAARIFGLATISPGSVALTFLGQRAVDPEQKVESRVDAFFFVTLYHALYAKFWDQTSLSSSEIEDFFTGMGIPFQHVKKARRAFKRSARWAGFRKDAWGCLRAPGGSYPLEISNEQDDRDRERNRSEFYVYVLLTNHGHYVGHTGRFEQRMREHFTKDIPATAGRRLRWVSEKFNTRLEAAHYEAYLKNLRDNRRPEYKQITNLRPRPYKF